MPIEKVTKAAWIIQNGKIIDTLQATADKTVTPFEMRDKLVDAAIINAFKKNNCDIFYVTSKKPNIFKRIIYKLHNIHTERIS